ncbi:MAG: serine protease [Nitrospira sp.]|nr:MAG: serine protease [Nitrospira sp.]
MPDELLHNLGGEANPSAWHFAGSQGPLPNPVGHTFPLLTHDSTGAWRLIGTGFYISRDGLFVTARHVIDDVLDGDRQILPLVIMHLRSESGLFGPQEYLLRPVMQCWLGDNADVALGVAAHTINNRTGTALVHWSWSLSWVSPPVGSLAATYAFPNHSIEQTASGQLFRFRPDLYRGAILDVGDFRDGILVPYPYMHVGFHIHGAASGGPVSSERMVVGVNCRFMDPHGPGVIAQIRCLQDSFIDNAFLLGETLERRVTFSELVAAGAVAVDGYFQNSVPTQNGRLVRLDNVPITTAGPMLEVIMQS